MAHSHVFLGLGHEKAEKRTWAVIWLCGAMMVLETVGGILFGSIALVADGLHMSTHAGALLLAAMAYRYARRYAHDVRFSFGTGKLGDLAGFTSAVVLAMIAVLIGYEAINRLFAPLPIQFNEAIPIAVLGLLVNIGSVWLLSGGGHDHSKHGHSHGHGHAYDREAENGHDEEHRIRTDTGILTLSIFEDDVPPRFRVHVEQGAMPTSGMMFIETERPVGGLQCFTMRNCGSYFESIDQVPEPHAFLAHLRLSSSDGPNSYPVVFEEGTYSHDAVVGSDNNMRAAIVHIFADAAVSILVIIGLLLARAFGWFWIDPLAGLIGACVIANWAYCLVRDTGAILLDMNPDRGMSDRLRQAIEVDGDKLADLHLWRLGPGHLGAILSIATQQHRDANFYRDRLTGFRAISHLTVEVQSAG